MVKTTISLISTESFCDCAVALKLTKTNTSNNPMRLSLSVISTKLFILIISCTALTLEAQQTSVNFDYLTVLEAPKGPIGFLGTGVSLYHSELPIYAGIRLNNAIVGDRGGYYTFGYHVGGQVYLNKAWSVHPRMMFTTGGGAESNDGSGGFGTVAATLDYSYKNWNIGLGAQSSYVSTGIIRGSSPYITLNRSINFYTPRPNPLQTQVFTNTVLSFFNEHNRPTGFIGVGGRTFQVQTFQSVYLTAAVTDLGGYMDVYGGYGIFKDLGHVRLLLEANAGTGGGGRAPAGGGALYGAQAEFQYHVGGYFVGLSNGWLSSLNEPFHFQFTSFRLGTEFSFNSSSYKAAGFTPSNLSIDNSIRTYLGESGFSNIGVGFNLFKTKHWSLRGESYWAFTDMRGAYAEGLFGCRYQYNFVFVEGQLGAGAGGGINLWNGAGLAFLNAGIDFPLSTSLSLNSRVLYNVYSTTAFPTYGIQLGFELKIPFTKA